ncbi:MFS transporter [Paraburkholderia acidisoli]|uniref:MFS transporter n=1 Tax=Paraburkholderia acidisoli TaxID=2571748 RepID=A0A7Z2JIL2_9BURK|nr:MFS transporter [Paraburkholderia acidisoli]QGZ67027.1 MFS transporter [Paraburkholderia acidisoli]
MNAEDSMRRNWWIIALIFVQWVIGYFDKTAISVLAVPIAKAFHFTPTQMGAVLSGFFLGFAAMTPIGGYLADRFGPRLVLGTVMSLWSIFTGMTGLAWSLSSLVVFRALFGLAEGSFPAASSAAVAHLVPREQRGRAKALLTSGASLGTAIGSIAVAAVASRWGWQSPFVLFGALGVVNTLLFLLISRSMRRASDTASSTVVGEGRWSIVLRSPLAWVLAATQFGVGFFAWGLFQWMPTYWIQVKGLSLSSASLITAASTMLAFFAMIGTGMVSDKINGKEGKFVFVLLLVTIAATSLTWYVSQVTWGIVFFSIAQIALSSCAPLLAIVVLKRMKTSLAGTATGMTNFGQQLAGVIAPTVMGFAIETTGGPYGMVFTLVMAVLALAACASLMIDRVAPEGIRAGAQHKEA